MEPPAISVRGLRMRYGEREVVRGIDLEVRSGEVFAFLGPNGAGKTTTVEILEGYRTRSAGEISVLGADPARADASWRARVGVVLQESQPEPELTVRECLSLYAGYYPAPRSVDETIELVGLSAHAGARCGTLSGGQQRRLDVALSLIGDPELVFFDEPTTGFDPSARRSAWELIAGLRSLGKTIFLTTHYMEEAEQLADRIAVIADGRIVAEGTPGTLGGRDRESAVVRFSLPDGLDRDELPAEVRSAAMSSVTATATVDASSTPAAEASAAAAATAVVAAADGVIEVRARDPLPLLGALATWAAERGVELPDLRVARPTLEDVYLQLTEEKR